MRKYLKQAAAVCAVLTLASAAYVQAASLCERPPVCVNGGAASCDAGVRLRADGSRFIPSGGSLFDLFFPRPGTGEAPQIVPDETPSNEAPQSDATESEAPAQNGISPIEREVVRLTNEIRAAHGLQKLSVNDALCRAARTKAADMAARGYFSHESPTYGSPFDMMRAFGVTYRSAGENIAYGYNTAEAVMDGWMNSEGHRRNILDPSFTEIGVGYSENGGFWSQMFTG